ncbi:MAG: SDR family oxidoreductase [Acidobacteriota bacterium]
MNTKNLLIVGATGGTGRQLVKQALEQNQTVTAFVRNPAKLGLEHKNLSILQGDVTDFEAVKRAVKNCDAVLSALGAPAKVKDNVRSIGTRNIIRAMEETGVQRFICMTTLGIGDSREILPFYFKYLIVPLILKEAFADSERQENLIMQSRLNWTIVRPANLTDGARTGTYQHGFAATAKTKLKISRADVADFMLKQLNDDNYLRKTPGISY